MRKTRSSGDLLFLLLAATRQTHTADRLVFPLSARTADSLLCRRCGRAGQSADHVFACSSVRSHLRMVRLQATELSLSVAAPLLGSLRVTDEAKSGVRSVCASADWCDPALDLGEFSRYAGLLGLLSRDLVRLLCPPPGVGWGAGTGSKARQSGCRGGVTAPSASHSPSCPAGLRGVVRSPRGPVV